MSKKEFSDCETLGERICFLRKANSFSLQDLASKARCSNGHMSAIEHDKKKPSYFLLNSLASALSTDVGTLLTGHSPNQISVFQRLSDCISQRDDPLLSATLTALLQ